MRRLGPLALAGALLATATLAQTTDYTSFDAVPGKAIEIGNYAAAGGHCTAGAPPTIKVVEPPKAGTLTVRSGERVYTIAGCPPVKMNAQVMTYQARADATGNDRFVFDIVSATGQVATHDMTIRLQEPPKAAPAPRPDIKF